MNIFSTIAALFNMLSTFIGAINKLADASDEYASIAKTHATSTHDEYKLEAKKRTLALQQQLDQLETKTEVETKVEV